MSMSEMGEEPVGEESGREPAERPEERPRRRWVAVRRLAGRVAVVLVVEVVRATVSAWMPELPDVTPVVEMAVQFALRLRRGRGGRPRG
ncbi:hypothetical protein ACFXJO_40495 [Streptomyces lavendulae]|uniref:hypothetical protein n=1 Tax=Streptomyces lavendulae TaxID=1914 RepID=UPI00369A7A75